MYPITKGSKIWAESWPFAWKLQADNDQSCTVAAHLYIENLKPPQHWVSLGLVDGGA